jgi:hypothetical protein
MFVARAYFERSRESVVQLGIVGVSAVFQGALHLYYISTQSGMVVASSFSARHAVSFAFFEHVVVPLFGPGAFQVATYLSLPTYGSSAAEFAKASWIVALCFLGVLAILCGKRARSMQFIMTVGFLGVSLGTTLIFANGASQARSAALPGFIFLAILVTNFFSTQRSGIIRWCSSVLLIVAIVVGSWHFRNRGEFRCFGGCPIWKQEVAKWRQDTSYSPAVWPNSDWRVHLPVQKKK